jgi:hypothetical protein
MPVFIQYNQAIVDVLDNVDELGRRQGPGPFSAMRFVQNDLGGDPA